MRYNLIMVSKYVTDNTYLFMKLILISYFGGIKMHSDRHSCKPDGVGVKKSPSWSQNVVR